jgi:hypothetical protein
MAHLCLALMTEGGDLGHIVHGQLKVKDIKVFFNTLFTDRLLKI